MKCLSFRNSYCLFIDVLLSMSELVASLTTVIAPPRVHGLDASCMERVADNFSNEMVSGARLSPHGKSKSVMMHVVKRFARKHGEA